MASDLLFKLTGGSSNNTPDLSLGGLMSSVNVNSSPMNNLFDDISAQQAAQSVGYVDYRAIDIYNTGDADAETVYIWIDLPTTSTDSHLEIGYDDSNKDGTNPGNTSHTASWNGEQITSQETAPTSPSIDFNLHYEGSKLQLPDIPPSEALRVWFKRVIVAGAGNTNNDLSSITIQYS